MRRRQAAFLRVSASTRTPMMSLSFMIRYSTPSSLTSVPDHLPNSTRSPTFTSMGMSLPDSSRPPGPTAMTSPCCGLLFCFDALYDDAIVKRTEFHDSPPNLVADVGNSRPDMMALALLLGE